MTPAAEAEPTGTTYVADATGQRIYAQPGADLRPQGPYGACGSGGHGRSRRPSKTSARHSSCIVSRRYSMTALAPA